MPELKALLHYFQSTCKPAVAGMPPLRWAQLTANVACAAAEAFIMSRANEKEGDAMVLAVAKYYDEIKLFAEGAGLAPPPRSQPRHGWISTK